MKRCIASLESGERCPFPARMGDECYLHAAMRDELDRYEPRAAATYDQRRAVLAGAAR